LYWIAQLAASLGALRELIGISSAIFDCSRVKINLLVQDNTEEGIVDGDLAVALNKDQR
jgi:hypothetical protein